MKLNEMNVEQMAEALCAMAEPVDRITSDPFVVDALKKMANDKKSNAIMLTLIGGAYARIVPLLLKKHKADTFLILSTLVGKSVDELEKENAFQLMRDIKQAVTKEAIDFFASSVATE